MNKYIFVLIFSLFTIKGSTQLNLSDPFSGKAFILKQYDDIQGTAFLFEDWKKAKLTDRFGSTFYNVYVKLDLYANKFFYNQRDTAYEFITDIKEITIFPVSDDTSKSMTFKKGFEIGKPLAPQTYVQVLNEGKILVLKSHSKIIEETTEYNVPGKIKSFTKNSAIYYIKDGMTLSEKPSIKILELLTKDKWKEIEIFMKKNSLNAKNEEDFIKLIKFYNSFTFSVPQS